MMYLYAFLAILPVLLVMAGIALVAWLLTPRERVLYGLAFKVMPLATVVGVTMDKISVRLLNMAARQASGRTHRHLIDAAMLLDPENYRWTAHGCGALSFDEWDRIEATYGTGVVDHMVDLHEGVYDEERHAKVEKMVLDSATYDVVPRHTVIVSTLSAIAWVLGWASAIVGIPGERYFRDDLPWHLRVRKQLSRSLYHGEEFCINRSYRLVPHVHKVDEIIPPVYMDEIKHSYAEGTTEEWERVLQAVNDTDGFDPDKHPTIQS